MDFGETQPQCAKRMYDDRSANYEDSWHPDYTKRLMALLDIKPGERVLDLCCGTGLDAFIAAEKVGDAGEMVGVDVSDGMLAVARRKQADDPRLGSRCKFYLHDVTDLETLAEVEEGSFDWLICSNAFVLFGDPASVVRSWAPYLRPGGRAAIDITHEHNLRSGMIMERVTRRLKGGFPANRSWIKSKDSFREILEAEGLVVEQCELLDKGGAEGSTGYAVEDADSQFDYITGSRLASKWMTDEFKKDARSVFRDEWAKAAVDGRVEDVDALYLYVARKA